MYVYVPRACLLPVQVVTGYTKFLGSRVMDQVDAGKQTWVFLKCTHCAREASALTHGADSTVPFLCFLIMYLL